MPVRGRSVGVLGGMGPAATWDFCAQLLAACAKEGAMRDQDHPRVLVDCDPGVPDRNEAMAGTGPSPAGRLATMARGLESAGADLLCMPCNAAHAFADGVREATALPFVDMIDATARATRARVPDAARVAVLATGATVRAGLYERAFAAHGLEVLPTGDADQERLMELIYGVKSGDVSAGARARTRGLADAAARRGADAVVAACTEVPLLLADGEAPVPVVSSTRALAEVVAELAMRPSTNPGGRNAS